MSQTSVYFAAGPNDEDERFYVPGTEGMDLENAWTLAEWLNATQATQGKFTVVGGEQDPIDLMRGRAWIKAHRAAGQ